MLNCLIFIVEIDSFGKLYTLKFKDKNQKHFKEACTYAIELGGVFENGWVTLELTRDRLLIGYAMIRMLFGYIQNWKDTQATFRGLKVHPYQFILHMHRIGECGDQREHDERGCLVNRNDFAWSCKQIDNISYHIKGNGVYKSNDRYWYNYGEFATIGKWTINKKMILSKLIGQAEMKGIDLCPFYDEHMIKKAVDNLPDFIVPDNVTFKVHFEEKYSGGQLMQVPSNIRHVSHKNYQRAIRLT